MTYALCFSCFDDITFQLYGQTPGSCAPELKRYTDAMYEGMTVNCPQCDRTATYHRNEDGDKWIQNYVPKEWPI